MANVKGPFRWPIARHRERSPGEGDFARPSTFGHLDILKLIILRWSQLVPSTFNFNLSLSLSPFWILQFSSTSIHFINFGYRLTDPVHLCHDGQRFFQNATFTVAVRGSWKSKARSPQTWKSHGNPMEIPLKSHGNPMEIPWNRALLCVKILDLYRSSMWQKLYGSKNSRPERTDDSWPWHAVSSDQCGRSPVTQRGATGRIHNDSQDTNVGVLSHTSDLGRCRTLRRLL